MALEGLIEKSALSAASTRVAGEDRTRVEEANARVGAQSSALNPQNLRAMPFFDPANHA